MFVWSHYCRAWLGIVLVALPSLGQAPLFDPLLRPIPGTSIRVSSANPDLTKNGDARTIGPGETLTVADLEGPGIINHIWCTVGTRDPFHGRSLVLRIYWDGAERPSVEAPLGDFFGVGHGAWESFHSQPVSISSQGRSRNCYWQMPFRSRAKVTVTNEATEYGGATFYFQIDGRRLPELPSDILYFHARYRQAHPAEPGDYTLLETTGRGHYVGTVFSVQNVQLGWFGEGDDRFWIDGEAEPSLRGTGTEDYFGDAWGFRKFAGPYQGVSLWEGDHPGDRGTAYRWHLLDPVSFEKSLRVAIEHKGSRYTEAGLPLATFEERPDWISSVAYWYQSPPVVAEEPLPALERRLPPYTLVPLKDLVVRSHPKIVLLKRDDGISYVPRKPDAWVETEFTVAKAGDYRIAAVLGSGVLYSQYQPLIDGKPVGGVLDLCSAGMETRWIDLDTHELEPGKHILRFEGRGASPHQRTGTPAYFGISLQSLILFPLEDFLGTARTK